MLTFLRRSLRARRDDGASAVEYGLLVAAIAALIVVVVFALGGIVRDVFEGTCEAVESGVEGANPPVAIEEGCPDGGGEEPPPGG